MTQELAVPGLNACGAPSMQKSGHPVISTPLHPWSCSTWKPALKDAPLTDRRGRELAAFKRVEQREHPVTVGLHLDVVG